MSFIKSLKSLIHKKEYVAFFQATKDGDLKKIEESINKRLDLEMPNDRSETVFLLAVFYNQIDIAKVLIQAGANVHIIELANKQNCFFFCKTMEMLNLLIENKVNLNHKDINNFTPLYYQINNYKFDLAFHLLENGANPNDIPSSILKASPFKQKEIFEKMVLHGFDYKKVYELGFVDLSDIQESLEMFELKDKLEQNLTQVNTKNRKKL